VVLNFSSKTSKDIGESKKACENSIARFKAGFETGFQRAKRRKKKKEEDKVEDRMGGKWKRNLFT
jgi:hypothetical protein